MSNGLTWKLELPNIGLFNPSRTRTSIENESNNQINLALNDIKNACQNNTPVGPSGQLRNAYRTKYSNLEGEVYNLLGLKEKDYGTVINYGRRPGKGVPLDALVEWLKRAPAGRQFWAKYKPKKGRKTYNSAAFIISMAIKNKGIIGKEFFEKGIEQSKSQVDHRINVLLESISRKLLQ
jgi:hypothetical protein